MNISFNNWTFSNVTDKYNDTYLIINSLNGIVEVLGAELAFEITIFDEKVNPSIII